MGRILALIAKANTPSSNIQAILDEGGKVTRTVLEIVNVFNIYYENLYRISQINIEG